MTWSDTFDGALQDENWGRYGWGYQAPGDGFLGHYDVNNVFASDGTMKARFRHTDGEWTSSGVSSAPGHSAVKGRWEVRAKLPQGQGFSFAFLLWPADGSWPPEVDFLDGATSGDDISGFYHYSTDKRYDATMPNAGVAEWHTYGVIMEDNRVILTLDGEPWADWKTDERVPDSPMWLGIQSGVVDENGEIGQYVDEVAGGVPNAQTPAEAAIEIDWVAHYEKA